MKLYLDLLGLILAVVLGIYVFLFGFVKKINEWRYVSSFGEKKHSLPPGDMGWPIIGNMWSFLKAFRSNDPDTFIYNLVQRHGRTGIYKTYLFGSPSIIVSIPETCRKVFADDEQFRLGYPISTKQLTGKKSFHSIPNSEHKRLRRLTTAPINGHEALSMSLHTSSLGPVLNQLWGQLRSFYTDLNYGMKSAAINLPGFAFHKALKARKMLIKILQEVLDERRMKSEVIDPNVKRGMIDLLMEIEDEKGHKLPDEDIIDLLLMFLLAGHESSAHVAMWAILYLHNHPQVLKKAKEEQEEILKKRQSVGKGLSLKDVRQMNYLQKVIDETLRRASVSFCNFREAKVDVNINGYLIPKGWKVLLWNRGVHMDPEVYSNPKEFLPERWENHKPKPGSFLPFGAGSRICPGADLAKLEISIFLHYFLLNFTLEQLNPGGKNVYLPIPRPVDNCLAKIVKIE
ncbi:Ent-kaurenoic acid oxidase 2 [Hibiscus syriacus]|uniref:Ent-kaurenoic acid oxidase 2 n=1 Tax=Hibiscus syriacus TaxID=106335 RepID=A0A6A2XPM0_HIBSY|nr:Ent-kaurenoic acid oxidase 2 [Hibiscus syriacus]